MNCVGKLSAIFLLLASAIFPQTPVPPDRLLNDEELLTEVDPKAVTESEAVTNWVRKHSYPLRSLTAAKYSDLQFLKVLLAGKRIIQLGENGHGVAEFNLAKVRLVKFLHQELGYEVIAFESPLYECYRADAQASSEQPAQTLRNCLLAVWHTREVLELFRYIQQTKNTPRPLSLAGFDVQQRGGEHGRPAFLQAVIAKFDPQYAQQVYELDTAFLTESAKGGESFNAYLQREAPRLIAAYEGLVKFLKQRSAKLRRGPVEALNAALVARQTAFSLAQLIKHRTAANRELSEFRDQGMAENLDFFLRELYPGKKVIVWGHNMHLRHKNEAVARAPMRQMGSWVAQRHRKELYTVGLYMYRGRVANNSRQVYEVARAEAGSLESVLYQARRKFLLLDLAQQKHKAGSDWLFNPLVTFYNGKDEERLVLREQYDGILFIDTVSPPDYRLR